MLEISRRPEEGQLRPRLHRRFDQHESGGAILRDDARRGWARPARGRYGDGYGEIVANTKSDRALNRSSAVGVRVVASQDERDKGVGEPRAKLADACREFRKCGRTGELIENRRYRIGCRRALWESDAGKHPQREHRHQRCQQQPARFTWKPRPIRCALGAFNNVGVVRYHGQDNNMRWRSNLEYRRQTTPSSTLPRDSGKTVQGGLRTYHTLLSSWSAKDSIGK